MGSVRKDVRSIGMVVALGTAVVAGGCSERPGAGSGSKGYNVLLVTLDTTRADRLGCYGCKAKTSPHLDALARDSVRFERAIAQASNTPVSHASILTGLNPYQHGVRVIFAASGFRLDRSIPTMATILRERGWQTAAMLSAFTVSEYFGLDNGFDYYDNGLVGDAKHKWLKREDGKMVWNIRANQRRSDDTTNEVVAWLNKNRSRFFLWVHYWDPHDHALVPPNDVIRRFVSQTDPLMKKMLGLYDAEVFYMDSQFGRLIQCLKDRGLYDNTIIVVVADHGQGCGDHGWNFHRLLYQAQIWVPLMIRIPGASPGVVADLVRTIDILPTVLETLGIQGNSRVEGRSLRGLMAGKPEPPRLAYADALNLYDQNSNVVAKRPKDDLLYCAMDRSWKLIFRQRRPNESELYHLDTDARETNNLYSRETEQAQRLVKALFQFNGFVHKPFGESADNETLDRMRQIGYVLPDSKKKSSSQPNQKQ